jgi:hypothetical protein
VVERPRRQVDVVRRVPDLSEQRCKLLGVTRAGPHRTLRVAGRTRGVDHRCRIDLGLDLRRGIAGLGDQCVAVEHVGTRGTVEDHDVPDLGDVPADLGKERRILGVCVDQNRIGVVDHVAGLVGRQPVVQRDRGRLDLLGRVPQDRDGDRVHAAPDDLVARLHPEPEHHVRDPVRLSVQLSVGPRDDRSTGPILDRRRFVRVGQRVKSQEVG